MRIERFGRCHVNTGFFKQIDRVIRSTRRKETGIYFCVDSRSPPSVRSDSAADAGISRRILVDIEIVIEVRDVHPFGLYLIIDKADLLIMAEVFPDNFFVDLVQNVARQL